MTILDGYQVQGMCQNSGTLDYVVALDIETNELRLLRFFYDEVSALSYIRDYKKIDKDDDIILQGNIYIDCKYISSFKGQNTYVLGIAGAYQESNFLNSYYFAKFNTKYNLTEYFVLSDNSNAMETPRGVKVDKDNQMIYLALEINKNSYNDRTVHEPGAMPNQDNPNVAIVGFSWQKGVRLWTTVIGNPQYTDMFGKMDCWGNYLYVFLNSFSTQYSTNSSQTDIYYYKMRASNGYIEQYTPFGSPQDDKIFDLQITFNGIYLLAMINTGLLPHKSNDKIWTTQNGVQNLVVILIDFEDDILDIEGYALTNLPNPYPKRLFVVRQDPHYQTFIFAAPRTNQEIDRNGGIFITQHNDSMRIFQQDFSCQTSCERCNPQYIYKCIACKSGYYLWKHQCYSTACPTFSFPTYNSALVPTRYCKDCHYSCRTCTDSLPEQCSTCCQNNNCGPIYNRVPNLGTCQCPTGLVDSNGVCVQRCILNLAGKRNNFCYPSCPADSYKELKYDQVTAQERSQYDSSSMTDCQTSAYHLKFNKVGKGLPLQSPEQFHSMPKEFTIAFWVRPLSLNTLSYFLNAFDRVSVRALTSGGTTKIYYAFTTSTTNSIEPVYTANNVIILNQWNYIAVSLRERLNPAIQTILYEQQIAIATSNMATVQDAGYDYSKPVVTFPYFYSVIYLGSYNDQNPQSFTGFLKEFKIFTKYHGIAQMKDEQLRLYRYYSYDDDSLVSYWKLTEPYTSSNIEYNVNDYSMNQNILTYSIISQPDYPQFVYDNSFELSLCTFHDVAMCRSLDYSLSSAIVPSGRRLTSPPTFQLIDASYQKENGDQIWYLPVNNQCLFSQVLAYMTYKQGTINNWVLADPTKSPSDLAKATHYQVCYFKYKENVAFNLYQIYIAGIPETIDPSNGNAFMADGVLRRWYSVGGDQAYGDFIKFSEDCQYPDPLDYQMMRTTKPEFGIHYMKNYPYSGNYLFCWQPVFIQDQIIPYYEQVFSLKYKLVEDPVVSTSSPYIATVNQDMFRYDLYGTFADGDQLAFAWKGQPLADCNPDNFLGVPYIHNYSYWPSTWFGYSSGVFGVSTPIMDEVHMCYKSKASDAPDSWVRIKKTIGTPYWVKVKGYDIVQNQKCPELLTFNPMYGSTTLKETDTIIQFNFQAQQVYPALQNPVGPVYGIIRIYRGAIRPDGSLIKTNEVLWENILLNDLRTPNPFEQGDLICNQLGQCNIVLSTASSRMKAGEIYYLSFYKNSFAAKNGATRYYLFNTKTLEAGQTTAYDHLFFCRSFDINSNTDMINGNQLIITGTDLLSKQIKAKEQAGATVTATFLTQGINLYLSVVNTNDAFCTSSSPLASVYMLDVTQTQILVRNLDLRSCNTGSLYADIEVIRGIRNQYGMWTHLRSEYLKNIGLGSIGCHSSCLQCNGTTNQNCIICADQHQFIYQGVCLPKCPNASHFYTIEELIFQRKKFYQPLCMSICPFGYYAEENNQCIQCNPDCQTCNSSLIASCLSCNPIKYLINGICVLDCPSPHHINNYTDYTCTEISKSKALSVKIQSLGYKSRIPKEYQIYLKADMNNDNGGSIISILWEQLEPIPTKDDLVIFQTSSEGDTVNKDAVVALKMTAFNFMSTDQVTKVKCTVTNSIGDVAYDIYEFYINQSPDQGNITITALSGTGNGTVPSSLYQVDLFKWTDQPDNSTLLHKLYLKIQNTYYTLTGQFIAQSGKVFLQLPLFSNSATIKNISICDEVYDDYLAINSQCINLWNVKNNLTYTKNMTLLIQYLMGMNFTQNITNIILASNNLLLALPSSPRSPLSPSICTLDYHCNYQGKCTSNQGIQFCECFQGFRGTFCQYNNTQIGPLQNISNQLLQAVQAKFQSQYELVPFDVELLGSVLRGICKDPDLVTDDQIDMMIGLIGQVASASIYTHQPVSSNSMQIFLDGLSAVMIKIRHSYDIQKAIPLYMNLANGLSLLQTYQKNMQKSSSLNITQLNTIEKPFMIGGQAPKVEEQNVYQNWGRLIDKYINMYIDKNILKLNPGNNLFMYRTSSFDLQLQSDYAYNFANTQKYIKSQDAYWDVPQSIFDNNQGSASDKHYITLKLMKWNGNPFIFEVNSGAIVDSNVTTITFFDASGEEIKIQLNDGEFIKIQQPWNKTEAYESELLRCMSWNELKHQFQDDNQCAFNYIWDIIPCSTCDDGQYVNTTVALCRCTHLSRHAIVFEQTQPNPGKGLAPGIYSDFFAMKYWRESMGFFLTLAAGPLFFAGHILMYFIDRKAQPKLLAKLRDKIRQYELRGFKQYESKRRLYNDPFQVLMMKQKELEKKQEEEKNKVHKINNEEGEEIKDDQKAGKKKKKKAPKNKSFKEEEEEQDADTSRQSLIPINKPSKKAKKSPLGDKHEKDVEEIKEDKQTKKLNKADDVVVNNEEVKQDEVQISESEMRRRYEEEVALREWYRIHPKKQSSSDEGRDPRAKVATNKIQKRFVKLEKKRDEFYWYKMKNMLIHGCYLTSLIHVTSILSPRHVRWTLMYTCIVLTMFWCAIIFNNTKDPLAVPDFNRKASHLTTSDLWVAAIAPIGTIILMYIEAGLFKLSDNRLKASFTSVYLENMLIELRKEMKLRYTIAYFITVFIYGAIFWYIVKFTSTFGWNVSWIWWYTCLFSLFTLFVIYDILITLVHQITYYCSRQLAIFFMKVRLIKQAKSEA